MHRRVLPEEVAQTQSSGCGSPPGPSLDWLMKVCPDADATAVPLLHGTPVNDCTWTRSVWGPPLVQVPDALPCPSAKRPPLRWVTLTWTKIVVSWKSH